MSEEDRPQMSEAAMRRAKWYRSYRFPLVPVLSVRGEDRYNRSDFNFQWLFIRVWSMMSPDIGIEARIDDQSLQARLMVPYLIIMFQFPLFPRRWSQKIWRTKKWTPQESGDNPQQWKDIL